MVNVKGLRHHGEAFISAQPGSGVLTPFGAISVNAGPTTLTLYLSPEELRAIAAEILEAAAETEAATAGVPA